MYGVFSSIKGLLKIESVSIDNNVFRLHYKATMFILVACSLLLTQKQFFGDPIDCIVSDIDQSIMDTYCWIHSTFTVPSLMNKKVGVEVPHPGISNPAIHGLDHESKEEIRYHKYYQWVTLFLYLQAILFYVPRYIWKTWEGGKIKQLLMEMSSPILEPESKREQVALLVKYFTATLHSHKMYFFKFFTCEALNFANVVGQIFFTHRFLGHEFLDYGMRVFNHSNDDLLSPSHPMDTVFPKVTKCTFLKYGPSGTVERHDGLCVLPLNIFNEKIFAFLWFWFLIIAVITAVGLVYRAFIIFCRFPRHILLRSRARLASPANVEAVARKADVGDWFVIYQLAKNMDPFVCKEFINSLGDTFRG